MQPAVAVVGMAAANQPCAQAATLCELLLPHTLVTVGPVSTLTADWRLTRWPALGLQLLLGASLDGSPTWQGSMYVERRLQPLAPLQDLH